MLTAICALAIGLIHARGPQAMLGDWRVAALIGVVAGWLTARAAIRRLVWHREEGVLAAAALMPAPGRRFLGAGVALGLAVLAGAGMAARPGALPFLLAGFVFGAGLGITARLGACPIVVLRRHQGSVATPLEAIAAPQLPFGWSIASGVVLLAILAATGAGSWLAEAWAPVTLAAGTLLPLLILGRVDHSVVRFLATSGHGAGRSALLHLAAGAAYLVPVAILAALLDPRALVVIALIGVGFGCYVSLRVWAYRAHARRSADTILALSVLGAGLVGALLPPLLVPLVGYLGFTFYRRAQPATWAMS
jgi:hypothetical protein